MSAANDGVAAWQVSFTVSGSFLPSATTIAFILSTPGFIGPSCALTFTGTVKPGVVHWSGRERLDGAWRALRRRRIFAGSTLALVDGAGHAAAGVTQAGREPERADAVGDAVQVAGGAVDAGRGSRGDTAPRDDAIGRGRAAAAEAVGAGAGGMNDLCERAARKTRSRNRDA